MNIPTWSSWHNYNDRMPYCYIRIIFTRAVGLRSLGGGLNIQKSENNWRLLSKFPLFKNGHLLNYWEVQKRFNEPSRKLQVLIPKIYSNRNQHILENPPIWKFKSLILKWCLKLTCLWSVLLISLWIFFKWPNIGF